MKITVVGNVIKDVYLNLDTRTETFERDGKNIAWLNLGFNASNHHFFNRSSNFGGAAVTLECLQTLDLDATISGSKLDFKNEHLTLDNPPTTYRYILVADEGVTYFTPSTNADTNFLAPTEAVDYLYIDRSAHLSNDTIKKIQTYLELSSKTKLVLYVTDPSDQTIASLLPRADLIFLESATNSSENSYAPAFSDFPDDKIVHLGLDKITYLDITEKITASRIDRTTKLSAYSILAATILGSFVLGNSVEESLKLARANVENSRINASLPLSELQDIAASYTTNDELELIAVSLVLKPKGILAADESGGSIHKKFDQLNIPDTYDNRRDYRNLFFTTDQLEDYVNGIILFDETAHQIADNGQNFVDFITARRIIPGIKVDQGLAPLNDIFPELKSTAETYTKGLDGLSSRLQAYYQMGLRFAKWRAAFEIHLNEFGNLLTPTNLAIDKNCEILASYAKACQDQGLVPIVEPEVVYDGNYTIDDCAKITAHILDRLFTELQAENVNLRACLLKVNMVMAGKQQESQSTPEIVGQATAEVLKQHVPSNLAGVVFLSGGQTPEQATANLAEIIKNGPFPWPVTFSFARALQDPALFTWAGDNNNADAAKKAFKERLIANCETLKVS